VDQFPTIPDYRYELAMSNHNLASLLEFTGHPQEAERAWRLALEQLAKLAEDFRARPSYRAELAGTYQEFGKFLANAQRPEEAVKALQKAIDLQEPLTREFASDVATLTALVRTYDTLGLLQAKNNEPLPAVETFRKSIALQEKLVALAPEAVRSQYQSGLGGTWSDLGRLLSYLKRTTEAREAVQQALTHQREARKKEPENLQLRQSLRTYYELLGALSEHGDAATAAGRLVEEAQAGWEEYHLAAILFMRAAAAANSDTRIAGAARAKTVRGYADRAVQMLDRAIRAGYRNLEGLNDDSEFAPLRTRADFQKLVRELEAAAKLQNKKAG
jgi:tetratricopeptide (TPR) repeat protein